MLVTDVSHGISHLPMTGMTGRRRPHHPSVGALAHHLRGETGRKPGKLPDLILREIQSSPVQVLF